MTSPTVEEENIGAKLRVELPPELSALYRRCEWPQLEHLLYRWVSDDTRVHVLEAMVAMHKSAREWGIPPPIGLIPIMPVDDASLACLVCRPLRGKAAANVGKVVRWHLGDVPERARCQVLDVGLQEYLDTVSADLAARERGLERMKGIANEYALKHGDGSRPRSYETRPIRLAVQNVIIGLAAFRYEQSFDGMMVEAWQACQVPHVNALEGVRGLLAMTLAQAFHDGGTMELRFSEHTEGAIPAVLTQFARTQNIVLGSCGADVISPEESRKLLHAVTPMPPGLREGIDAAVRAGHVSPERACVLLLAKTWNPVELEFILRVSPRANEILRGGSDVLDRVSVQAEYEICAAAAMLGMLVARLSSPEAGPSSTTTVLEDERTRVGWIIDPRQAVAKFGTETDVRIPWLEIGSTLPARVGPDAPLFVLPRIIVDDGVLLTAEALYESALANLGGGTVAILHPRDAHVSGPLPPGVRRLVCPDDGRALAATIERKLQSSRIGRK